jgi:LCP family protein required for cell wall assembly
MDLSMISVPRDLWVRPPGYRPAKINTLYRTSTKYHDNGFIIPKVTIEDIFGLPIHYYAFIDFKAFTEVIDALGGVDVTVDNKFTDSRYPDGNFGYITISFDEGFQSMDGELALEFARSRHGNNGESSDFARSRRQQKIILGIKDKLLSFGTLFKINDIVDAIKNNYQSNIKPCEIYSFLLLGNNISKEKTHSLVLDDGPGGLLYTPMEEVRDASYGGQYILLPDGNNYKIIRKYVERFLNNPKIFSKGPSVAVLNGTNRIGLANKVGALLTSEGFNVTKRDNTYNRENYKNTVIYSKTPGDFYQSILSLQGLTNGDPTSVNTEPLEYGADIVLILGSDYKDPEEKGTISTSENLQY